jgi:hypothetical protein
MTNNKKYMLVFYIDVIEYIFWRFLNLDLLNHNYNLIDKIGIKYLIIIHNRFILN